MDPHSKSPATDSTPLLSDVDGQPGPSNTRFPYNTVYQPVHGKGWNGKVTAEERWVIFAVVTIILGIVVSAELYLCVMVRALRNYEYPFPTDVDLNRCVTAWSRETKNESLPFYPYSVSTSFEFPLPSKTLLLLSKGALSNGRLKIAESSDITDVQVNVTVKYYRKAVRDSAKVCVIERYKGESGVGIFTPSNWRSVFSSTDRIFFEVELTLPRTGSALYVPGLTTDVNNFSHDVASLNAHFGVISLTGSNGKIQTELLSAQTATFTSSNAGVIVDSLVAQTAVVRTSNGHISGNYTVSDSLDLRTSNSPIDVAVAVKGNDTKKPKNIVMDTSNGELHCVVDLTTTSGQAGAFNIRAHTSNAPLQEEIASAPLDSVLTVDAKTSNREASVALPSTYEGSFEVVTSNAPATFERVNPGERDPACKRDEKCSGRSRVVHASTVVKRSSVAGTAYWDQKNADRGKVSLTSSNGPTTLYL